MNPSRLCTHCGAEIVRGATRRERRLVGVLFAIGAFIVGAWFFHAWGVMQGPSLLPRPDSDAALFAKLGLKSLELEPRSSEPDNAQPGNAQGS